MIDFGSGQGLSDFETGGIACYFEDFKREKTPPRADGKRENAAPGRWNIPRSVSGKMPFVDGH
ncbi:MAG: hypothetical protein JRJ41_13450 [Deltaproteobacteria bacterium]|nr:hypothetical protein [Deltaproteobacteria bacterium]